MECCFVTGTHIIERGATTHKNTAVNKQSKILCLPTLRFGLPNIRRVGTYILLVSYTKISNNIGFLEILFSICIHFVNNISKVLVIYFQNYTLLYYKY